MAFSNSSRFTPKFSPQDIRRVATVSNRERVVIEIKLDECDPESDRSFRAFQRMMRHNQGVCQ